MHTMDSKDLDQVRKTMLKYPKPHFKEPSGFGQTKSRYPFT